MMRQLGAPSSAILLFLCVLSSWPVGGQSNSNATLSNISIWPCSGTTLETVSLYKSDIYTVVNNVSLCGDSWTRSSINGFVVHAHVTATGNNNLTQPPVVFVARQHEEGVVSWTIPLQLQGFSTLFYRVNRTMCPISPQQMQGPDDLPLLYIDVFSSSPTPLNYSISIEAVQDFDIKVAPEEQTENSTHLIAGAAAPQIRYVKFPNDSDVLTVQADTENFKCAYISIQNKTCPVNDLLRTATSQGIFQTMSTTAFLTVRANEVRHREFLIVIITTNYSVCHSNGYIPINGTDLFEQKLNLQVKPLPPSSSPHIVFAIILPLIIFSVIGILGSLAPFFFLQIHVVPLRRCSPNKSTPAESSEGLSVSLLANTEAKDYQSIDKQDTQFEAGKVEQTDSCSVKELDRMMLPDMCQRDYEVLKKSYSVYSWNTVTVAIFYALPAFQLVFSQQRLLNTSGNQDQCYYNFKCAYPVGVLSAFNNIWSNVGYVILGLFFLCVVWFRNRKHTRRQKNDDHVNTHGVPQYFGIYYAMGFALIVEGFMSAFYHICPSNANFQFDTAFMFIIGGIFLVKVFQNRHPDIHTNAFLAFFTFAVLILFTLVGLYYDHSNPIVVRLILFAIVLGMICVFFVSFYYFHQLKFTKESLGKLCSDIKDFFRSAPKHKCHFFTLILAFIANILLVVVVVFATQLLDVPTSIVVFFLMNLSFFLFAYFSKKLYYKEPLTILPLILPVLIVLSWAVSFVFFFKHVSNWGVTPAESRELNKECIVLGFYDNHDVWHFLSACGMFFTFLFMLVVDDGVADVPRENLHVF